jgi:hypothetical protein
MKRKSSCCFNNIAMLINILSSPMCHNLIFKASVIKAESRNDMKILFSFEK